jgi:hypothetical protein
MFRGSKRWVLRFAILLTAGLTFLVWAVLEQPPGNVRIENHSRQQIARLRANIAGEVSVFTAVAAGQAVVAPIGARTDEPCTVEVEFADGSLAQGRFGSISSGVLGRDDRLVISPEKQIVIRRRG